MANSSDPRLCHACFSETLDLVNKMRDRGAKVAIASNSPQDEIQIILERSGFPLPKIDVIVGKSAGLRKKPAPDIFLRALEMLGLDAGRAIVLEDSNRGLSAAAAAGCGSIWIRTQYNQGLSTAEPHLASMTHKELLGVFQNLK
jgi:beta-phosphoglucomutase-like phosphatase (HAD superfamily)